MFSHQMAAEADDEDGDAVPDLHTQLEDLLDAVSNAEKNWRFDDLLNMANPRRKRLI